MNDMSDTKTKKRQYVIHMIITAVALGIIGYSLLLEHARHSQPVASIHVLSPITLAPESLTARAAIVYDPSDGQILFSKNSEMQLPLASLTKLMTADAALSVMSATSSVRFSKQALATEGSSGFKVGETWPLGKLIRYSLLVSSNQGMAAVAESAGGQAFIEQMNTHAQDMSLAQTYFLDPTGLDLTTETAGAYGSPHDVAMLAADFYRSHPSYFESTLTPDSDKIIGPNKIALAAVTAAPLFDIPGLIGAKTGYTDLAGGNLVVIFDESLGHPLVAVVLHSTEQGRYSDIHALINAVRTQQ